EYNGSSENLTIPASYRGLPITEIGDSAFQANKHIKGDLIIPENIIKIGNHAFSSTDFNSLVISKNVKIIDDWAFSGCENLTNVTFHDNIKEIRRGAFYRCRKLTGNLNIPKGLTKIDSGTFGDTGYTGLTIPNNIKIIESDAFGGANLTGHIIIPDSVIKIGDGAFSFTYIEKITIPKTIKKINDGTFRSCGALKEFIISEGIIEIEDRAFFECFLLKSVVIPSTVTSIGKLSLGGCNNLTKIICNAPNPPAITDITFENSPIKSIIVPNGSIDAYQKADFWKEFANIVTCK
ncbi:MAG: leucine-rich repeat domain-containing protein, partial [Leptospirales bacterium]|nr:leucine-rich repeat domain-containing protein [Leptospirales bacterium]